MPGVPLKRDRVTAMGDYLFPAGKPRYLSETVVAAIDDANLDAITGHKGSLVQISPLGLTHALYYACARDITSARSRAGNADADAGGPTGEPSD